MNRDFSELLLAFNEPEVEYLLWVRTLLLCTVTFVRPKTLMSGYGPTRKCKQSVEGAVGVWCATGGTSENDLTTPGTIFQIGLPPLRVDILTEIDGVNFDEAWSERFETTFGRMAIHVISRRHLIGNKRATGRLQVLADIERLEAAQERSSSDVE